MSKFRSRPAATTLLVSATLFAASLPAQTTPATQKPKEKDEEVQKLEKFEVTGSRVKRLDLEGTAPVVQITNADITRSGYRTLGDFVQSLPFNTGSSNSVIQTASFTRGAATLNPRGLGSNRFLVLVNGRRALTYALTNSNNQSVFDFNSIPVAAIESIEYLKDGASAIYGSDAVTGVMNIKLKKNYTGAYASVQYENTMGHDTGTLRGQILAGARAGKTSIMVAVDHMTANANYIRDFDRSSSTDYTRFGDLNKGANLNSTLNFPANINFTAAQATAAGYSTGAGVYVLSGGQPTSSPTKANFVKVTTVGNENRYDFAQTYQLSPELDYTSAYVNMRHDITDNVYLFGELIYGINKTKYSFTPSVIQSTQNVGTGPTGLLNIPANNPYNPFGIDITNFLYRTNFGPPRMFDTDGTAGTGLIGVGGELSDWSWEVGFSSGSGSVATVARNQIRATDLQAALNGTTRATALNPWGPSDNKELVDKLFTVSNSSAKVTAQILDATISTPSLFSVPWGGDVGLAVGSEFRRDTIRSDPDTQSYVGSGGGTPYRGDRDVKSAFAEVTVPLAKNLAFVKSSELQVAARYEKYSDFGDATKPKVGLSVRPNDWFILRGSFSKSFKAPDLGRLYTAQTVAFSSTVRTDPKRPQDPAAQMRIITGGNPNLKPENAEIYYGGVVVDVKSVKGLSFSVDYFNMKIADVINTPTEATLLSREDQFPGGVVRDNTQGNPGPILYLRRVPFNVAMQWYEGYDLAVQYDLRETRLGKFRFRTDWTRITSIASDNGFGGGKFENLGLYNNPKWRGTARINWERGDWGAILTGSYIGAYWNDAYTVAGWQEKAVMVANAEVSYRTWQDIVVTVGCSNIADKAPPFNGRETTGFDQSTYGFMANGRTLFVKLEKEF